MVYLGVKDLQELERAEDRIEANGDRFATFIEPDIGDEKTATACFGDPQRFRKYKLL